MSGSQLRSATNQRFQLMLEKTKQNLKKQDKLRSYSAHDVISTLLDMYGHWTMALAAFQTAYVSIVHQLLKWDFNHAKEKISLQFLYRIARSQEKGIVCARITCFNWRSPKPSNA